MPTSCIEAAFFDLDGVLVDSRRPIARSLNYALQRHGLSPLPEPSLHRFIGAPLREVCIELLEAQGGDPELADGCMAAYRESYRRCSLVETSVVPGIGAALARLSRERPLAVVTSKPTEFARPILAGLGVLECFRGVFGPRLDPYGERKARTLARALAALGLDPRGAPRPVAVLVGDRVHDVEAGREWGLTTVGVGWGIGTERELRDASVDHFVTTPAELVCLLERL